MIYASTPPINDDPEPWQSTIGSIYSRAPFNIHGRWFLAPRHEYDRPRAHEANPILLDLRRYIADRQNMANPKGWDHIHRKLLQGFDARVWDATSDEYDHAGAVLSRWLGVFA